MIQDRNPARSFRLAQLMAMVAFLALSFYVLHDFFRAIVWASVIAVALWPLYQRFAGLTRARSWCGIWAPLLFTTLIVAILLLPIVAAALEIRQDFSALADAVSTARSSGFPAPDWVGDVPYVGPRATQWWNQEFGTPDAVAGLSQHLRELHLADATRSIGTAVMRRSLTLIFTILILFFLLRDGTSLARMTDTTLKRLLGANGPRLSYQIVLAVRGAVLGLVLVGLGEGVVIGIAYAILGVPHPILFAAATALLSAIPVGAMVVVVAGAATLFAGGHSVIGIGLVAFGAAVTFVADHFIRPVLIGGAAKLPFILVLLALLGGLEVFGVVGLFIGPAVLSASAMLWRTWLDEPAVP